jgi:hypothetical protein
MGWVDRRSWRLASRHHALNSLILPTIDQMATLSGFSHSHHPARAAPYFYRGEVAHLVSRHHTRGGMAGSIIARSDELEEPKPGRLPPLPRMLLPEH